MLFAQQPADATPVIGLGNLAHSVDSLDKTVLFYRDVLGLPVNGARSPETDSATLGRRYVAVHHHSGREFPGRHLPDSPRISDGS